MNLKPFKGSNVFMSRNLVPPELYATLHDALKLNGANVFLCCDPSRNAPDDYHVISSSEHEKFEDLRAKGCNLVGPQCVLSCAKERRSLPKRGFTCCLAMDSVKVIASGFDSEEKGKITKLVAAMGGILDNKTSADVSFVIVKNVIAAKYKWAVNVKKPIVSIEWLHQCWNEHRIVPQESYRVPFFSGLIICVTGIPADERKEMEKAILQNGGKYSAELTRACTHLICEAPEGDKYKVARRWGHIRIVTRKWFHQSIVRRACLGEEAFPVHAGSTPSNTTKKGCFAVKQSQDKSIATSQSFLLSTVQDSNLQGVPCSGSMDSEMEATVSRNHSVNEEECAEPSIPPICSVNFDRCVADDSQSDDDDLYLSDCKICLVGFVTSEMRRLVNMIRRGGGSRYMSCSERLTHIVVGVPSDVEKKELRALAALGVIHVVRPIWLEDCIRAKKEIPVAQRHIAHDLLFPKDLVGSSSKGYAMGKGGSIKQDKVSTMPPSIFTNISEVDCSGSSMPLEKGSEFSRNKNVSGVLSHGGRQISSQRSSLPLASNLKSNCKLNIKRGSTQQTVPSDNSSSIFEGKLFYFSSFFPKERRDEVVQWINQGRGEVVGDLLKGSANFIVECHGVTPQSSSSCQATYVSSHWVRSCLEDGSLLNVASHMLYSPLPCRIPLPGFEGFRFCVSQYDEKDRLLLRNLCFILGAKFGEKLTRKVTHLICIYASGPKYEGACKWGIQTITCEWIYECVRKNEVAAVDSFRPKEVSRQDHEVGLCTVSQYPTQAAQMISDDSSTQLSCQTPTEKAESVTIGVGKEAIYLSHSSKKARLVGNPCSMNAEYSRLGPDKIVPSSSEDSIIMHKNQKNPQVVPDVAAAIEDLLEQTSKIHDPGNPAESESNKTNFTSDCPITGSTDNGESRVASGPSKPWLPRGDKQSGIGDHFGGVKDGAQDVFSETQTESQLVGYEEDLSGRQMIIERVRTRSMV